MPLIDLTLNIPSLFTIFAGIGGGLWFLWKMQSRIRRNEEAITALERRIESAELENKAEQGRRQMLADEFSRYREHVAKEYASRDIINEIKKEFSAQTARITERLDRIFINQSTSKRDDS